MTMSISRAPAATEASISASLVGIGVWPAGNPVDTAATGMSVPASAALAAPGRVIARERREVHAAYGLEQPRRLPCVLDRASTRQGIDTSLDGAQIDANRLDPAAIVGNAPVADRMMTSRAVARRLRVSAVAV